MKMKHQRQQNKRFLCPYTDLYDAYKESFLQIVPMSTFEADCTYSSKLCEQVPKQKVTHAGYQTRDIPL